jgi:hypothetical protein
MAAVRVPSFGVVAGQPAEDFAAAGGGVGPAATVLEDFAFEGGVERFGQCVIGDRPEVTHGLSDAQFCAELRETL